MMLKNKGFTLMEVSIVLLIFSVASFYVIQHLEKRARDISISTRVKDVATVIEQEYSNHIQNDRWFSVDQDVNGCTLAAADRAEPLHSPNLWDDFCYQDIAGELVLHARMPESVINNPVSIRLFAQAVGAIADADGVDPTGFLNNDDYMRVRVVRPGESSVAREIRDTTLDREGNNAAEMIRLDGGDEDDVILTAADVRNLLNFRDLSQTCTGGVGRLDDGKMGCLVADATPAVTPPVKPPVTPPGL